MSDGAAQPDDALVGRILHDTYRVMRKIAEGGMGAVYAAEHARLPNKRFAIKVLHPGVAKLPQVFERFRREAMIASELGHPNIVDVLDFFETREGQPFLVMEYLEGQDLAAVLRARGRLSPDLLEQVLSQVGSALAAAHELGVVHRDLKPENIFVTDLESGTPTVKVLDFGISKIRDSKSVVTQAQAVMGTPYYMSPEQAEGQVEDIDHATDIFALGTICYEALTGKLPFDAPTMPGVIYKICHAEPEPPSLVWPVLPPQVDSVIAMALAKKKEDRFLKVSDFVSALVSALHKESCGVQNNEEASPKKIGKTRQGLAGLPEQAKTPAPPAHGKVNATCALEDRQIVEAESADVPPPPPLAPEQVVSSDGQVDHPATEPGDGYGRETDPYPSVERTLEEPEAVPTPEGNAGELRVTTLSRSVGEAQARDAAPAGRRRRRGLVLGAAVGALVLAGVITSVMLMNGSPEEDGAGLETNSVPVSSAQAPPVAFEAPVDGGGPVATPLRAIPPDSGSTPADSTKRARPARARAKAVQRRRPVAEKKRKTVRKKPQSRPEEKWEHDPFSEAATGKRAKAPSVGRSRVKEYPGSPSRGTGEKPKKKEQIFTGDL